MAINPINFTSEMLPEEVIKLAHQSTAIPSLIYAWFFFALSSFIVGFFIYDTSHGRGKFILSWTIFIILSLIFTIFLSQIPLLINETSTFFVNWFN